MVAASDVEHRPGQIHELLGERRTLVIRYLSLFE